MLGHQAAFVDHLLDVIESEGVDLVVVSGDIDDRALPPVDAVRLADETLVRLARSRATAVLTSGNHDSAQRLGFSSRLIDEAGIHLRTDISEVGNPVLLHDEHGPVAVHGIPYLDPHAVRDPWQLPASSHQAALTEAMVRVRRDLDARSGTRSIVLAHAFVAGAQPSESERDITVGGVARVPTSVFDGIDYVALGHLHGQQSSMTTCATAAPRWPFPSPSPTTSRAPGWSTWAPGASHAEFVTHPRPDRWPASVAAWTSCWPTRRSACTRMPGSKPRSPTPRPPNAMDRLPRLSRTPCSGVRGHAQPARRPGRRAAPPARRPRHRARVHRRAARQPRHSGQTALLDRAVDSCCHDDTDPRWCGPT